MKGQANLINSLYILIPGRFGDNLMAHRLVTIIHVNGIMHLATASSVP